MRTQLTASSALVITVTNNWNKKTLPRRLSVSHSRHDGEQTMSADECAHGPTHYAMLSLSLDGSSSSVSSLSCAGQTPVFQCIFSANLSESRAPHWHSNHTLFALNSADAVRIRQIYSNAQRRTRSAPRTPARSKKCGVPCDTP